MNEENEKQENMPDPMEFAKKQWEAMGVDPNTMMQYMNNAMDMQKNMQQQMQEAAENNPMLKNMLAMQAGLAPEGDMLNMYDDSPEVKEDSDLTEAETKAMLCGANLSYYNSQYLNTLSTFMPVDDILGGLEAAWDVNNREELLETIDWLENAGHKIYFDLIWEKLRSLPKAEWKSAIKQLELQAMTMEEVEPERLKHYAINLLSGYPLLLNHGCFATMKDPDISAWDFARAINLCRFGYDVEFLSRAEALEKIQNYAAKMYQTYDSWKSLSEGYLVGFAMWNGDEDLIELRLEQHETLLTHEKSLWNKVSW